MSTQTASGSFLQKEKTKARAYAATSAKSPLAPFTVERRAAYANDVVIDILYCGICHSDLHQVRNEWNTTTYPIVPGHEIVGKVSAVGKDVKKFKEGELVGVGCIVDSCRSCSCCKSGLEQFCLNGFTGTYNGEDKVSGGITYGGYSERVVVDQNYVLKISDKLKPEAVAPLLCAGITTYSPLKRFNAGPGKKVGIVGLGGLGHMGVKIAHALGAHVVVFTTSPKKAEDARRLGADEVVVSTSAEQMLAQAASFDLILDAVSAEHDINAYLSLLKVDGTLVLVGAPEKPLPVLAFNLIIPRRQIAGSLIGGIEETQEMLDFCAEKGIVSDIELINIEQVNEAYERLVKGDVKYRFVIDMASLKQ